MRTLPILLVFLVMGVADAMGPLASRVQTQFQVSAAVATLLTFFVFIAFAVFSVPGGLMAARMGKKKLLLLGLGLNALALAVPSFMAPNFNLLLGCIFVLGVGTTFLQVAGNPIMRDVSGGEGYAQALSLAQGIKGVGSFSSAWLVGGLAALLPFLQSMGWRSAFPIFFALMVLALVSVALLPIEEAKAEVPPSLGSSLSLLKEGPFAWAVLGIFLYVGAEVCMNRFLQPELVQLGVDEKRAGLFGAPFFLGALTLGRLVGSAVLARISPRSFFRLSALLGCLGIGAMMLGSKPIALAGVILGGLGFANIWPLLFSITVERRPDRGAELSGLMCMAISGGAVVPLLMGRLADKGNLAFAFIVPLACFAYLLVLSMRTAKEA